MLAITQTPGLTVGYVIEAVIIVVGVMMATFLAKRQMRKRSKLAF